VHWRQVTPPVSRNQRRAMPLAPNRRVSRALRTLLLKTMYNSVRGQDLHNSSAPTGQIRQAAKAGLGGEGSIASNGYSGGSEYVKTHGGVGNMAKDAQAQAKKYGVTNV